MARTDGRSVRGEHSPWDLGKHKRERKGIYKHGKQ
jgi:hypothetical protein